MTIGARCMLRVRVDQGAMAGSCMRRPAHRCSLEPAKIAPKQGFVMGIGKKAVLGGREAVKVAIVQKAPRFLDKDASLTRAETYIAEAAAGGAELIVFPEVWLAGYPYWTEGWDSSLQAWAGGRIAFRDAAVLAPSEDTERLGAAARRAGAYVVMGCNEIDPRPEVSTIYNSLLFFDRDGRLIGRHRKTMPTFTERMFWGQGDAADFQVFDTDIGRLGGLICGEHLMTLVRAAMIGLGEEIHVAVFPGAFALHTGPALEEWDADHSSFWGHASVRAHALEAGAFVVSACGITDESDIPDSFPHKGKMNIRYARGGSSIIAPLGIPLAGPVEGPQVVYGNLEAWMLKAWKSIIDTAGHYSRPDIVRLVVNAQAPSRQSVVSYRGFFETVSPRVLADAADARGVDPSRVEGLIEQSLAQPALIPAQAP
jgi:nitrilase